MGWGFQTEIVRNITAGSKTHTGKTIQSIHCIKLAEVFGIKCSDEGQRRRNGSCPLTSRNIGLYMKTQSGQM